MHAFVAAGGHDGSQLTTMGMQAQQVVGKEELTMIAARGYFNGSEILSSERQGLTPLVPKPLTSGNRAHGLLDNKHSASSRSKSAKEMVIFASAKIGRLSVTGDSGHAFAGLRS